MTKAATDPQVWRHKWEINLVIEWGTQYPEALGLKVLDDIEKNTDGDRRKLSLKRISQSIKVSDPDFYWASYSRACEENGIRFSQAHSVNATRLATQAQEILALKAQIAELEKAK